MSRLGIGGRIFLVSFTLMLAGAVVASAIGGLVFVNVIRGDMDYAVQTAADGFSREFESIISRMRDFGQVFGQIHHLVCNRVNFVVSRIHEPINAKLDRARVPGHYIKIWDRLPPAPSVGTPSEGTRFSGPGSPRG